MSNEQKLLDACVEYRAKLDELERENAALRDALVQAGITEKRLKEHADRVNNANDQLIVKNASLLADKARLDFWNSNNGIEIGYSPNKMSYGGPGWYWQISSHSRYQIKNVRDCLDSAMAYHKKPKGRKEAQP